MKQENKQRQKIIYQQNLKANPPSHHHQLLLLLLCCSTMKLIRFALQNKQRRGKALRGWRSDGGWRSDEGGMEGWRSGGWRSDGVMEGGGNEVFDVAETELQVTIIRKHQRMKTQSCRTTFTVITSVHYLSTVLRYLYLSISMFLWSVLQLRLIHRFYVKH